MWCIHPTYCENIHFKDLIIRSTGGNGDGIDVDSCKHVLIEGCDI
jgi:polygalacturonase